MIWLFWRRMRLIVVEASVALAAVTVLAVVAVMLGSSGRAVGTPAARIDVATHLGHPVVPPRLAKQVRVGVRLMEAAVAACLGVGYHGVQMVAWSSPEGAESYLVEVWHRSGQSQLAEVDHDADDRVPGTAASNDAAVAVLSITSPMLSLLRANYLIEYAGAGEASDRPALIVEVRRHDGTLAARYWLDRATGLPLRREMYDERGRIVNEGAFLQLQIGDQDVGLVPGAQAPAWSSQHSADLAALHKQGWSVPQALAGDMALTSVTRTATPSGATVDASYSDGLSVVSVFMQRGELPDQIPGWTKAHIGGRDVLVADSAGLSERGVAWSYGGFVYTVIADAPPSTVTKVVGQLPHASDAGFWERVTRGLKRIGSWFDPFN
jgi:sigma-E factor negative regulatory protein RseB